MWKRVTALVAVGAVTVACSTAVDQAHAVGVTAVPSTAAPAATAPSAAPVNPDPRVGAVFLGGETMHTCSGSVLDSTTRDLILTAAHCVADGADTYFEPGFDDQAGTDDVWHVDTVYLDPRWVQDANPVADFAIARVSRDGGGAVEDAAGGGFRLGSAPTRGTEVTLTGYEFGVGGGPIGCRAPTAAAERGFPSLPCSGLSDGTSGSPWVSGSTIIGLTGGLDGGGCDESVSYSPPLDDAIVALLHRAEAGGPGDTAPAEFEDDC